MLDAMTEATHGSEHPGPLRGMRVLELAQIMAGPTCGMLLADMSKDQPNQVHLEEDIPAEIPGIDYLRQPERRALLIACLSHARGPHLFAGAAGFLTAYNPRVVIAADRSTGPSYRIPPFRATGRVSVSCMRRAVSRIALGCDAVDPLHARSRHLSAHRAHHLGAAEFDPLSRIRAFGISPSSATTIASSRVSRAKASTSVLRPCRTTRSIDARQQQVQGICRGRRRRRLLEHVCLQHVALFDGVTGLLVGRQR